MGNPRINKKEEGFKNFPSNLGCFSPNIDPLNLGFEDSQSLLNYRQIKSGVEESRELELYYTHMLVTIMT